MKVLAKTGVIEVATPQKAVYPEPARGPTVPSAISPTP